MSWLVLVALGLASGLGLCLALVKRVEVARTRSTREDRERLLDAGMDRATLLRPVVDLSRCLGCATCVQACPEREVLGLAHGQAVVVHAARCRGVRACERECPVGAITLSVADAGNRDDLPALDNDLQALGVPGLYLAGEVTAQARVRTAVEHGRRVAAQVASRRVPGLVLAGLPVLQAQGPSIDAGIPSGSAEDPLDLLVVGAGPAGLACALEARRLGLRFAILERESEIGGTVARYPRGKLVLTEPFELPLVGRFGARTYTKEELVEVWRRAAAEHDLPLRTGTTLRGLRSLPGEHADDEPLLAVDTDQGTFHASHVCLAVGRRGEPRRLGIPGEDLPHVTYGLQDAHAFEGHSVVVVGGGDSAVEAALALARRPAGHVVLVHRGSELMRVGRRNREALARATQLGRLELRLGCQVRAITPEQVLVSPTGSEQDARAVPADHVLVLVGGTPARDLLLACGVSCDPADRIPEAAAEERGTGLLRALLAVFLLTLTCGAWALAHGDYYLASPHLRAAHLEHDHLRPGAGLGLALGLAASAAVLLNLAYLLRRSPRSRLNFGSLGTWMTVHVASGVSAVLLALAHGGFEAGDTVGGHAWWALVVLLLTGAVGRYLYAWVPRAANGHELALEEVRARLHADEDVVSADRRAFRLLARERVLALVDGERWRTGPLGLLVGLLAGQRHLRRVLAELRERGRAEGVPDTDLLEVLALTRTAHRRAVQVAHAEELRSLVATWRWAHRWLAGLMVLLLLLHVGAALLYGERLG